jgi:uncharacterized protein YbjQ (UPF0145 family)
MKNFLVALVLSISGLTAMAQAGGLDGKWLNYMVETERRAIFQEGMLLTDSNKDVFWALYDEYETELEENRKKSMQYLKSYAEQYESMTDEQATDLTKQAQANTASRLKLQKKYFAKMNKVLGGKIASRFVQIDNAIYMLLSLQIMDEIPMIGDYN